MAFTSHVPFQLAGRYAARNRWEVVNGPGDARVTGAQIVQDEGIVDAWADKVILVTGVSSGIGVETVRALEKTGARIYGTARNIEKATSALGSLLDSGRVKLLHADHTDMASIRACADTFREESNVLNILINNAAVMNIPETRTQDGLEVQFVTNHLSHFLLFYLLQDLLLSSSSSDFKSRVVNVSSAGHRYAQVNFDNINYDGIYNGWLAYGSSKTANIYMANHIDRLYGSQGLHAYSVHPGSFYSANLQKYSKTEMEAAVQDPKVQKYLTSLEQACATTVYGAVSQELEEKGALYLEGAAISEVQVPPGGDAVEYGYAPWAYDEEKETRLWNLSKAMVGVE